MNGNIQQWLRFQRRKQYDNVEEPNDEASSAEINYGRTAEILELQPNRRREINVCLVDCKAIESSVEEVLSDVVSTYIPCNTVILER